MRISANLLCLYSAQISDQGDTYTIELPKRELEYGNIQGGETYRVAVLSSLDDDSSKIDSVAPPEPRSLTSPLQRRETSQELPVSEGETREVDIESFGDEGDGIAKIERGYVLVVPDTEIGERVTVRLDDVRENFAFAEVVERHHDISDR